MPGACNAGTLSTAHRLKMDLLAGTAVDFLTAADSANGDGADGDVDPHFFVTDEMILDFSEKTRLEDVTDLVLRDMRISSLEQFDRLPALATLSVAHNCLTRFDWKGGCWKLTELNVSHNKVWPGQRKTFFWPQRNGLSFRRRIPMRGACAKRGRRSGMNMLIDAAGLPRWNRGAGAPSGAPCGLQPLKLHLGAAQSATPQASAPLQQLPRRFQRMPCGVSGRPRPRASVPAPSIPASGATFA